MFKGLSNLAGMLKEIQQLQGRAAEMQDSLGRLEVEGRAGGEMVVVRANGLQQVVAVQIDPSLLDSKDREMVEDLLQAATNQALEKSREAAAQAMSKLTSGMEVPGLAEMMSKLGLGGPGNGGPEK
jgi:nucleoid-associated protein EbfC